MSTNDPLPEGLKLVAVHVRATGPNGVQSYFKFSAEMVPYSLPPLLATLRRLGWKHVIFSEYEPLPESQT